MSVLFKCENYSILDHQGYISKIYDKVLITPNVFKSFVITKTIFSISNEVTSTVKSKKRKKYTDAIHYEASAVQLMFTNLIREISAEIIERIRLNNTTVNSASVRNKAKDFFESTIFAYEGLNGGNSADFPVKCKIRNDTFLIPNNCQFFCGDVKEYCQKLDGRKYDIVIADPPWWNKYIRRLKVANSKLSYSMMYNEDIASIPVKNLFADNCLVAVWCTNSPSNVAAVKDLIFPKWEVEYVTTWYWLKVNTDFKPLCEFASGSKKQPYERIILGKVGNVKRIPKEHLIVSVPSALHSHKIPLNEVLTPYVDSENPDMLELFARYLLPNTTSVGYEPLKWQHISLYKVASEEKLNETECC